MDQLRIVEAFDKTNLMFNTVVEELNEHMINLLIKKKFHEERYNRDYQIYWGQADQIIKNKLLQNQMDELDELEYLKEKKIDENYSKGKVFPGAN